MKTILAFGSFLLTGSQAASLIQTREYRPNERLMLVDCGIGTLPNGASTSREMAYYSAGYNPGGGNNQWVQPEMIANVPWDGSYPWRGSGATAKFPNGDQFTVWINPAIKDWDESKSYAGDAVHTYGAVGFKCWAEHGKPAFKLADGKTCTSAYMCWHMPDQPNPPPPGPVKYLSKTDYTMSEQTVNVRVQGTNAEVEAWKPRNAFGHIRDAIEGNQCSDTAYDIGSDCKISFHDCLFTLRDKTDALTRILVDAVAPAVERTRVTKKGHYNGKCPPNGGPCEPGYDFEYGQYTYPETGTVLLGVYPETDPGAASPQSFIRWRVTCSNSGFCGSFCSSHLKDITDVAAGLGGVPPLRTLACLAC